MDRQNYDSQDGASTVRRAVKIKAYKNSAIFGPPCSLYIKRGKLRCPVSVLAYVTVGVVSSVANDVTMRMTP